MGDRAATRDSAATKHNAVTGADVAAGDDTATEVNTAAGASGVTGPPAAPRVLVIIPTYCEVETLPRALAAVRQHVPGADVLVVDDASPDGTGDVADAAAADDARVHVLHRPGKAGLGAAYVHGFGWGLERGYDVLVEMDADGSHRGQDLPRILAALERPHRPDLVLGSRWVPGGSVLNWPASRQLLSRAGNVYARLALGLKVRDSTGGFRAYRATMLRRLELDRIASAGYCFQVDMVWRVLGAGGTVEEVPITFVERDLGESKMSRAIVAEAFGRLTVWGLRHRALQVTDLARGRRPRTARSG